MQEPNEPAPPYDPNEPTILEQALELHDMICCLEDLWITDPNIQQEIDPNDWQAMMDSLYDVLDAMLMSLTESELMAYNLLAADCGGIEQMMSGGDNVAEASSFGTFAESIFAETVESEPTYAAMSTGELSSLVNDIYLSLDSVNTALAEEDENAEDWLQIRETLENILVEIQASRQ